MRYLRLIFVLLLALTVAFVIGFNNRCNQQDNKSISRTEKSANSSTAISINTIDEIPLPAGFTRVGLPKDSFGEWLRNIKLKKDNTVYLYNGRSIARQDLHYAVLDISTGNKDLQQCADAIMRLKSEYYFSRKEYDKISFRTGNGTNLNFDAFAKNHSNCYSHDCLLKFLEKVFMNCGTYTVDEMTKPISINDIESGDVFVKAGSPGHAMIVVDVAIKETMHKKVYMLAQSYMPAQDMHIVINPDDEKLSPWYEVNDEERIITPGWIFDKKQLKRWK